MIEHEAGMVGNGRGDFPRGAGGGQDIAGLHWPGRRVDESESIFALKGRAGRPISRRKRMRRDRTCAILSVLIWLEAGWQRRGTCRRHAGRRAQAEDATCLMEGETVASASKRFGPAALAGAGEIGDRPPRYILIIHRTTTAM